MELTVEAIIGIATLLLGGSGIVGILTWRAARKKANAEASSAEFAAVQAATAAIKDMQDSYRQMVSDVNADRDEQRKYIDEQKQLIEELKEDRRHLRAERDEQRVRLDKVEKTQRDLQYEVARLTRMVAFFRPMACGRQNCPDRVPVATSDSGGTEENKEQNKIEPYNGD